MKITAIEISQYVKPLDPPFKAAWDPNPRVKFATTLVKVMTDEGVTGIGSGDLMVGFAGHENLFIGQDPFLIERHWQILDNIDFHYGRCWPLDAALWDLMGKALNKPVASLLGAKNMKIKAYASTGAIVSPEERAERALMLKEAGFAAMKIRFHHENPKDDIRVVEAVRKAVGNDMEIMVDANQGWKMPWDVSVSWDLKQALLVARELEKLNVFWLEEPLSHYDFRGLARLRQMTDIRIAGGEMNRRWSDFREMSRLGSLDVYQPDAVLSGGITMVKKIAEQVQAEGAVFSPHTWSNGIGVLTNLHLACAVSNCLYLELPFDPPVWTPDRRDFIQTSETRLHIDKDGYLNIPDKPGLGFELSKEAMEEYKTESAYFGEA